MKNKRKGSIWLYIVISTLILINFFSGCIEEQPSVDVNREEPFEPILTPYQNWTLEYFGSTDHPESSPYQDSDADYVDNLFEFENGTDPTTLYTFESLDDFNLLYSYRHHFTNLSDRNLTQKEIDEFLKKIPDVEPRHWTNTDGSARNTYADGKYIKVSLRDPLVKHFAKETHIEWSDHDEFGKMGWLKLGDEPLFLEYGRYDYNKTTTPPAYFLTNGRKGNCLESAIANAAVLLSKGYKCTLCSADTKPDDGKDEINHAFLEAEIDGKIYMVNYNGVGPREVKDGASIYDLNGWKLKKSYDPNWVENENYNYM